MYKYILISLIVILRGITTDPAIAQTSAGLETLFVKAGTETNFDGLLMIPSQDIEFKDNTLVKTDNVIKWPLFNSIKTVYNVKNPFLYGGELGLFLEDGALNGNIKANLKVAFSQLVSGNYNDFSILNSTIVNGNLVLARPTTSYLLGSLTAVSRESTLSVFLKPENFFTPNGDGINDKWVIPDIQLYPNNIVTVYDRAGRQVFQMSSYDNSWSGLYKGSPLAKGTYYYSIRLNDTIPVIKGFITIVR